MDDPHSRDYGRQIIDISIILMFLSLHTSLSLKTMKQMFSGEDKKISPLRTRAYNLGSNSLIFYFVLPWKFSCSSAKSAPTDHVCNTFSAGGSVFPVAYVCFFSSIVKLQWGKRVFQWQEQHITALSCRLLSHLRSMLLSASTAFQISGIILIMHSTALSQMRVWRCLECYYENSAGKERESKKKWVNFFSCLLFFSANSL